MKTLLVWMAILASAGTCTAQGSIIVNITILNNQGNPLPDASIQLFEPSLNETVKLVTDASGKTSTTLNMGLEWQMSINHFPTGRLIKVPQSGRAMTSVTETYNPEDHIRASRQTLDRTGLVPITQNYPVAPAPKKGFSVVEIKLVTRTKAIQPNIDVYLLDTNDRTYYHAVSDKKGIARFVVPSYHSFDVDVESYLNASSADPPQHDAITFINTVVYDKPDFRETISGDTVVQDLEGKKPVASGRSFYTLTIEKNGLPAAGERFYLKEIHGSRVFLLRTDDEGKVDVLLPFGRKYMIHFDYQPDVDVIDLTHAYGQSSGYMTVRYIPDPKLEHPELFIPDSGSLFLVDFETFLKKQYPKPVAPKKVRISAKFLGKINAESREAVVEIGYTAMGSDKKTPLNISFILDISGSMAGYYRIERLKTALAGLISKMEPDAMISIVAFASNMQVVLAPQKLGGDKGKIISLINGLNAGGGTNMLEALKKGYAFVAGNLLPRGNNMVIVLSDGYDENEVKVLLDVQRPYKSNIICTTVGVGSGYNYALLNMMASNGNGQLHFVGEADDFNELFNTKLFHLLKPVATNVTLEIEYNQRIVFKHLYGPQPAKSKSTWPRYLLPNLYSGSNNIALAKFDLVKPDISIEKEAVIIRIMYTDEETGQKVTEEQKIVPEWTNYTGMPELIVEAETKKMYCIAVINQGIKKMSDLYSMGNNEEAQKTLERTREQVIALYPKTKEKEIDELMVSMDNYLGAFRNLARKKALQKNK